MLHHVLTGELTFTSLTPPDLSQCSKSDLLAYFENSYSLNESLFTALKDESVFYKCPDRLRLPLIFYYGHTAVVFVNKLALAGLLKGRINFEFEKMFETGVDEMSWDDTENYRMGGSYKWPRVGEVVEYRRKVREVIRDIIRDTPLDLPINMKSPWWALLMGFEHERIHLETSSVLIRQLPIGLVNRPDGWNYAPKQTECLPQTNQMLSVNGQEVTFGKPTDFPSYGWDNEYGHVTCYVPAFEASKFLVTNGDFLDFIRAGGYSRPELWTDEGWHWRSFRESKHPMFWVCNSGCKSGCGTDLAAYSHCSLPEGGVGETATDANYNITFKCDITLILLKENPQAGTKTDHVFTAGSKPYNYNMKFGSSTPVDLFPANELGFHDVFGNVWQWTEDHFNGLCNDTHWLYDDFTTPCYDGRHNIILGGSWISTGDEASRFARFAFRRHFLQHAGFRLARTAETAGQIQLPTRIVDTPVYVLGVGEKSLCFPQDKLLRTLVLSTNIHYHFESANALKGIIELEFGYRKSFPVQVADLCRDLVKNNGIAPRSGLWIGAGSGRGPLIMSKSFNQVLACDVVARFLETAMYIQKGNDVTVIGADGKVTTAALDKGMKPDKVLFKQFTWLPNEIGVEFDLTVLTFLERTQQPKAWLLRLAEVTQKGGLVVVASKSGRWNAETLGMTLIQKGLSCIETAQVPFEEGSKTELATVTVWKHGQE
ncbi:uncharacterized protein LOC127872113 [Dreissena polymorpha]|uniref:uncharacterized protein LOC127872113 n=1 Tax=Dreissena polymorpha TaxID=45954 RepID=UPI002264AF47|nr:uncharacterized protein LOC127872113 [Dreissena polymorpha]